jgi:hypothetical protein
MRGEQILAAEITDDALLGAALLPVGLDEANVFVLDAFAALRPSPCGETSVTAR